MFLHQGQREMKELRFHPQFRSIILTTAEDSFNIFRPNLDPDFEDDEEMEESKENEKAKIKSGADYSIVEDSDEDVEAEERRMIRTARQINKQNRMRSQSKKKRKVGH